jgi:hypothetical protein
MFSRTIFADKRTEKIATHQRLVRAARRIVPRYVSARTQLPSAKQIVHFEGKNGPDGLAGKHNIQDFPMEMLNPTHQRHELIEHLNHHLRALGRAHRHHDEVRVAFELAWSEHLIVDGLTPAHHHDYSDQVKQLDPRELDEINSILKRIFVRGAGLTDTIRKNWKKIGPRGVATNHILFEAGIDFITMPLSAKRLEVELSPSDLKRVRQGKFVQVYLESVRRIADLHMFERYEHGGWSTDLVDDVRNVLLPECVKCIALGWLSVL